MAAPAFISKHYPKAYDKRVHKNDTSIRGSRIGFVRAAFLNFGLLQFLFFGIFAYIFGSLFQQSTHAHNVSILYVDYDGGAIGEAIRDAYKQFEGIRYPTLIEKTPAQYATPADMRESVCGTKYWAALYTSPGASDRLAATLSGDSPATLYNRTDVLTYIWNEALYSAISDSLVSANLQTLSNAARISYLNNLGDIGLQAISPVNTTTIPIFANPWTLASIDIQPTVQGSRIIYNTLVIIIILIQEFFYLGTINGLYGQFKLYTAIWPHRIIFYRTILSLAYTFVGSLSTAGMIWAFRDGWGVNAAQFFLSWATLWLFAHANFLCMDVMSIWIAPQFLPMAVITWIMFNVTSILVPFDLSPAFYKWGYVMPAHEAYQVLTDIWSGGCNPKLHYALPILFSLEVLGLVLSAVGVYRRCHYAIIAEQMQETAFQKRLDSGMEYERKRDTERQLQRVKTAEGKEGVAANSSSTGSMEDKVEQDAERDTEQEEKELGEHIRKEDDVLLDEQNEANRVANFGPTFDCIVK